MGMPPAAHRAFSPSNASARWQTASAVEPVCRGSGCFLTAPPRAPRRAAPPRPHRLAPPKLGQRVGSTPDDLPGSPWCSSHLRARPGAIHSLSPRGSPAGRGVGGALAGAPVPAACASTRRTNSDGSTHRRLASRNRVLRAGLRTPCSSRLVKVRSKPAVRPERIGNWSVPSGSGVARDGENEKNGSHGGGWMYD